MWFVAGMATTWALNNTGMPRALVCDQSAAGHSTNHSNHSHNSEDEDSRHFLLMVLGSCAAVLALTAGFDIALESLEERLEERGDPELVGLLAGMQKELSVLGFIGLSTFVVVRSGALGTLFSSHMAHELVEVFESVHIFIFWVMCVFFVVTMHLVEITHRFIKQCAEYERPSWKDLCQAYTTLHEDGSMRSYFQLRAISQVLQYRMLRMSSWNHLPLLPKSLTCQANFPLACTSRAVVWR